jgi:hypothetical protein
MVFAKLWRERLYRELNEFYTSLNDFMVYRYILILTLSL